MFRFLFTTRLLFGSGFTEVSPVLFEPETEISFILTFVLSKYVKTFISRFENGDVLTYIKKVLPVIVPLSEGMKSCSQSEFTA